ncbi:hypothetical protein [Nocardioides coralli]|uniref:hypothetical protein n=1 Tax=Nocardioides coralli TaxID=2872154 RepID=UPI001CA433D1|nr:hypothetical protein [Nocardioides coralli]QZY28881.1 hypothetical protein K6T13_15755 [Nocardioides coralli]
MSTMVVRMTCQPEFRDEVVRHLRADVVTWAHEQEGFVAGSWHVSVDGRRGIGVVEFDSGAAAEAAARAPREYHDPDVPFRIDSVEIYDDVATSRPGGGRP